MSKFDELMFCFNCNKSQGQQQTHLSASCQLDGVVMPPPQDLKSLIPWTWRPRACALLELSCSCFLKFITVAMRRGGKSNDDSAM